MLNHRVLEVFESAAHGNACIVDQNVKAPVGINNAINQFGNFIWFGHVGRDRKGVDVMANQFISGSSQPFSISPVDDNDCTKSAEFLSNGFPDTHAGTRN